MTHSVAVAKTRLKSEVRREVLLDAAQEVLLERGSAGLTMEGIAARAGVNKALPYRHFDNAQAVLVELFIRFNAILGARVLEAVAAHEQLEDRVRATVAAYLDVVRDHRAFLTMTVDGGSDVPGRALVKMGAENFVADLVVAAFGVRRRDAPLAADLLQGALASAAATWSKKLGSRRRIEQAATAACLAIIYDFQ